MLSSLRARQGTTCNIVYRAGPCASQKSCSSHGKPESSHNHAPHAQYSRSTVHTTPCAHTTHPAGSPDTTVHIRRPGASPGHRQAQLGAYERFDAGGVAGRPLERALERLAGGLHTAHTAAQHHPRLGGAWRPLLAAADRARRQARRIREEEAPCTHGHAPPRANQSQDTSIRWGRMARMRPKEQGAGESAVSSGRRGVLLTEELPSMPELSYMHRLA